MTYTHTIVGHFPSHAEAERVVLELQKEGFDMQSSLADWQRLPDH